VVLDLGYRNWGDRSEGGRGRLDLLVDTAAGWHLVGGLGEHEGTARDHHHTLIDARVSFPTTRGGEMFLRVDVHTANTGSLCGDATSEESASVVLCSGDRVPLVCPRIDRYAHGKDDHFREDDSGVHPYTTAWGWRRSVELIRDGKLTVGPVVVRRHRDPDDATTRHPPAAGRYALGELATHEELTILRSDGIAALALGGTCRGDFSCRSGFCRSGVCCESACIGSDVRCDRAPALGLCVSPER
jgi:hypothetical protein